MTLHAIVSSWRTRYAAGAIILAWAAVAASGDVFEAGLGVSAGVLLGSLMWRSSAENWEAAARDAIADYRDVEEAWQGLAREAAAEAVRLRAELRAIDDVLAMADPAALSAAIAAMRQDGGPRREPPFPGKKANSH